MKPVCSPFVEVEASVVVLVGCERQPPHQQLADHLTALHGVTTEQPLPVREIGAQFALDLGGLASA
jgi:hypothetical protein